MKNRKPLQVESLTLRAAVLGLLGLVSAATLATGCSGADPVSAPEGDDPGGQRHTGALLLNSELVPIHYEMRNGAPVWQGDIDLRVIDAEGDDTRSFTLGTRSAMLQAGTLWPNGSVPYRFDATISTAFRTAIQQAITHWNQKTVLDFTYDSASSAPDYMLFTSDGSGCHAGLGHSAGANPVVVSDPARYPSGCAFPQIVHEIGHAIGLRHEMQRPDRDGFVKIQWGNICSGQASVPGGEQCANVNRLSQFVDTVPGNPVGAFDFASIMLYPATTSDPTFAVDPTKPIVTRLDGTTYPNPQTSSGLSAGDLAGVASLYGDYGAMMPNACLASAQGCGSVVTLLCQGGAAETPLDVKILPDSSSTPTFVAATLVNPASQGGYFSFTDPVSVGSGRYTLCLRADHNKCGQEQYTVSFLPAYHDACTAPGSGGGGGAAGGGGGVVGGICNSCPGTRPPHPILFE